ncbi:Oidioi.mRNA.OKI2018_I69.PAR.g12691.t1.cds [Oikopleura dioica]|uniref:Oidioi.mRNA.OKI2018_I69.PAR.g12691.t1.cds n=1 Tax=Oikopleura dioica TaxID=34765 RepID=A0ABN7S6P1_OIKDI|nr:Oidioi.mRNA.OKI2018_I69.PAR.g12691.t1.cds [Oikopleura dioica]
MDGNIKLDTDSISMTVVNMTDHDKERLAKENHSDIERRRRNKMTQFINELAELIPACNSQPTQTKPDKLSILKWAADHAEQLPGAFNRAYPYLVTLEMFDHIMYTATRGCFLLLGKFDLEIINHSETAVEIFGKSNMTQMKFLDFVHEKDKEIVRNLLCATINFDQNMLDMKSFTVRTTSAQLPRGPPIEGVTAGANNNKRECICRLKTEKAQFLNASNSPSSADGYCVATITASLIPAIEAGPYNETWAVLIRQEQPIEPQTSSGLVHVNGGAVNPLSKCTVKIGLDGTIAYCDDFIVKLLDLEAGAQKRIIGKKFWEVFSEKLGSSQAENDLKSLIMEGCTREREAKIVLNKNGQVLMCLRPIVNPSSKKTEFIIASLKQVPHS